MSKKLDKKLKSDPKFIPYNQSYDFQHIQRFLKKNITTDDKKHLEQNALCSRYFNIYYKGLKDYYSKVTQFNKLSNNTFLKIIITLANRDVYLMLQKSKSAFDNKKEVHYDEMINSHFQSAIPELGTFNAQAGLEASQDGLNTIINLNYQDYNQNTKSSFEFENLDKCFKLLSFSNIYTVIKSAYDMAVWEGYSLNHCTKEKTVHVKCLDNKKKKQIINRIGEYRLERNVFASKMMMVSEYKKKSDLFDVLTLEMAKKRKTKKLEKVTLVDGKINFELIDGIEKNSTLLELLAFAGITSYYSFIKNEELPNFDKINLRDVLLVFTEIQYLVSLAFEIKKEESNNIKDLENFNLFKIYIKKNDLLKYIFRKTKLTVNQIKQIINLFIHIDGYANVWEKPLIEIDNKIFPVILPLLHPNQLRMTDYWLEAGGFDLDQRGKLFEEYLKNILKNALVKKGYRIDIPKQNIFTNKNGNFEEIDLIVELKKVTIMAEIKCIKFPFDPRDYHNMNKRLTYGANQISRKVSFIEKNIDDFKKHSFFSKPIIKTVITNYPIFSGLIIEGVPITDASLIDNYFINGALNKGQMFMHNGDVEHNEKSISSIIYYKNEDELSDNLKGFLQNPIPISEKLKDIFIEEKKITLPSANPQIIMD